MKFKRSIALMLTGIMASSFISIPAIASDESVVFSYINDNGIETNITQSELDTNHWDPQKLNGEIPIVFKEFPASIEEEVGEFSELNIYVKYMKNDVDYANLVVKNILTNEIVFSADLTNGEVEISKLPIGESYQFTITESISGTETVYNKLVNTMTKPAAMPEYVTDHSTDSEQIVLVGNIEDLKASEHDDGQGNIEIDGNAKRFEQVKACGLGEYIAALNNDSIYKLYTRDESDNTYLGYINTSADIEDIYMPTIEVLDWDSVNSPQAFSLGSTTITASTVLNAASTNISQHKDYSFDLRDSSNRRYQVYKYEVPDVYDDGTMHYDFLLNASASTTLEVWLKKSGSSMPVKRHTETFAGGRGAGNMVFEAFGVADAKKDDYLYFVMYTEKTSCYGYFSFHPSADEYTDDVCGSVYEIYSKMPSTSVLNMDEVSYYYTITDYRDVDTFYLNYTGNAIKRIKFTLNNTRETTNRRTKYLETYILTPKDGTLPSVGNPGDVYEVAAKSSKSYKFDASYSNQYFMLVSDIASSNSGSINFNILNNRVAPCSYSIWSGYRN